MQQIEFMLNTTEIAEMMEITHWELLRKLEGRTGSNGKHIKGYVEILGDNQMVVTDFFRESTYITEQNKEMPCYQVTRKGCEFLANKFTGEKGVLFTARYINRFHEMQDILLSQESEPELPWFIHKFDGQYIMRFIDFEAVTGVSLHHSQPFWKAYHGIMNQICPMYWNGYAWYTTAEQKEAFKKKYGFEYGEEPCMKYLYPCGIRKALELCMEDKNIKLEQSAYSMIMDSLKSIQPENERLEVKKPELAESTLPVQIGIIVGNEQRALIHI